MMSDTTRDALLLAARLAIDTNGGPIDSDSTIDGKAYVMVERSAFDGLAHAIDAALAEPHGGMPELPEPNLPEGDWFVRDAYIKEYAKHYGRACAEAARKKDEELMQRTLAALMYARDSIESWGAYASDYFATKHDLAGDIRRTEDAANALRTRLGDKHE